MRHEHHGYGLFPGGDPRRFAPDAQDCSPEEIAKHKAACEAWDAAEKAGRTTEPVAGAVHGFIEGVGGFIACGVSGFGIGVYTNDCDDPDCVEAQAPLDPDDAYGAFERWWEFDAQVSQVVELPADESVKDKLREAFAAGFRAGRDASEESA